MSRLCATSLLRPRLFFVVLTISFLLLAMDRAGWAQSAVDPAFLQSRDRITRFIDDGQRITLQGNRHPLAVAGNDAGAVPQDFRMDRMLLTLLPDAAQQQSLSEFIDAQYNAESPYYHQWLTPNQFADRFGVSETDTDRIVGWLQGHGLEVEEVTAGRRSIIFGGSAAQVQAAFHTQIRSYNVRGEIHHANANEPEIPIALAEVVGGIVSLHDFHSEPMHASARKAAPEFTRGGSHYLSPADFAIIYNLAPLYQQSINGSGQSIAIVGRSNIRIADVRQFRSAFGLPANDPLIIVNGADPGIVSAGEETEADLDVEWSGAVARNATIKFVVSKSTNSSDGVDLSAQYIVNHNLAPIMSTSFGLCEAWLGSSGNNFLNSLWQQAAAEGITVLVSSGDDGAAGCDSASAAKATNGRAVNGLCSTPYSVCVGGTQFADVSAPFLYWSLSDASGTQASALSYIPELAWNESGPGESLWSSGGGMSTMYAKPSWQTGLGVPADGKRDVPDVSLSASGHDGYLIYQEGSLYVVGGTSAASPSFAGVMALVAQGTAARPGNANHTFYPLAGKQRAGGAAVFHDITSGSNSVPGQTGFNATSGYDQATGLGSIDASILVSHWGDATVVPGFQPALSAGTLLLRAGANSSVNVTVNISGGFNAGVALSVSGLPAGVSAAFTPAGLSAPGAGSSVLKITAASTASAGTYSATIAARSGATTHNLLLSVTIAPAPSFTLTSSAASISVSPGSSQTLRLTTTPNSTFDASITLTIAGLPSGLTAQFLPSGLVASAGAESTTLTLSATPKLAPQTYSMKLTATGGGVTQHLVIPVTAKSGLIKRSTTSSTVR